VKRIVLVLATMCIIGVAGYLAFASRSEEHILVSDGLGPVRIGMTVSEAEVALGTELAPMDQTNETYTDECWITGRADNVDPGIGYTVWDGKIVRIDAFPYRPKEGAPVVPLVKTARGIDLNSSVDSVKNAYGADLVVAFHPQGDAGDYNHLFLSVPSNDKRTGIFFVVWQNKIENIGVAASEALGVGEGCV
jgi:hypothetical protein